MSAIEQILPSVVCEMGGIRIGRKGPSGAPVKLDHFIITTPDKDEAGNYIPDTELMAALDPFRDKVTPHDKLRRLRTIPVMLGSNTIADSLRIRFEWWPGRSRIGASSGNLIVGDKQVSPDEVTVTFFCDPRTGQPLPEPAEQPFHKDMLKLTDPADANKPPEKRRPLLKISSTLSVVIACPDLRLARFGGVHRFRSKGWHTATQLVGSLQWIKHNLTSGILRGPGMLLKVGPKTVRPNGIVNTAQVVWVEPQINDLVALRQAAREQALYEVSNKRLVAEIEGEYKALVAARQDEDEGDDELVIPGATPAAPQPAQPAAEQPRPAAANNESEQIVAQMKADLRAAFADEEKLAAVWADINDAVEAGQITRAQREDVAKVKDECKAIARSRRAAPPVEASAPPAEEPAGTPAPDTDGPASDGPPAEAPPPAEPKPAFSPPKAGDGAKVGAQLAAEIERLVVETGFTWQGVRSEFGAAGRIRDLTPQQALDLRKHLKERQPAGATA